MLMKEQILTNRGVIKKLTMKGVSVLQQLMLHIEVTVQQQSVQFLDLVVLQQPSLSLDVSLLPQLMLSMDVLFVVSVPELYISLHALLICHAWQ